MSGPGGKTVTLPNFERHMEFTMPDIPKATMSWRSSMLGVEAEPLKGSQLASFFGVSEGVLVRGVIKDTSAEKAGIKAGDVIVKIEGTAVEAPRDITTAINAARKDGKKTVNITLVRDRKETTVSAAIEDEASSMPRPRGTRVTVKQNNL
jgi:S1-C subfamily serine protease